MSVPQFPSETIPTAAGQARLAALMGRLTAWKTLDVRLVLHGLVVTNTSPAGCCGDSRRLADTITCRRRPDDGGRLWFYTSWNEPIAEAAHIIDAAGIIAATLRAG